MRATGRAGTSVDMGVGDGTLGGSDIEDGVGVIDDEGDEGIVTDDTELISVIGVRRDTSWEEYTEPLGRKNDVSKEVSRPSGSANDCTEGDARNSEDSYDSSDSAPQIDSGIAGLEGVGGCSTVDGTVGVTKLDGVGETDVSVGDETVDTEGKVSGRDSEGGIGEGPGIDSAEESSTSDCSVGDGEGAGSSAGDNGSSRSSLDATEGL